MCVCMCVLESISAFGSLILMLLFLSCPLPICHPCHNKENNKVLLSSYTTFQCTSFSYTHRHDNFVNKQGLFKLEFSKLKLVLHLKRI